MDRLIHETTDPVELELLDVARAELPPAEARQQLVALLERADQAEIDQALRSARGNADREGAPGVPNPDEPSPGLLEGARVAVRAWTSRFALRPALVGIACGLVVGVGATVLVASFAWQPEVTVVPVGGERVPQLGAVPQPASPRATALPQPSAALSADRVQEKTLGRKPLDRGSGPRAPVPPAADQSVGSEVGLLDEARRALSAGDTKTAFSTLDRHSKEFRVGALGPEAAALRIQALVAAGDPAQAEAQAERFLSHYPDSPHARRVRALLAKAKEGREATAAPTASGELQPVQPSR